MSEESLNIVIQKLEVEKKTLENAKLHAEAKQVRYFWLSSVGGLTTAVLGMIGFVADSKLDAVSKDKDKLEQRNSELVGESEKTRSSQDRITESLAELQRQKETLAADIQTKRELLEVLRKDVSELQKAAQNTGLGGDIQTRLQKLESQAAALVTPGTTPVMEAAKVEKYTGMAGKVPVTATLSWHQSRLVEGEYLYQDGRKYFLRGLNYADGRLQLSELDQKGKRTATVDLKKSDTKGSITWSGTMRNTDGREFDFQLRRKL